MTQAIETRYGELAEASCCLSCGRAVGHCSPEPGQVCVDLGSGRGTDVLRLATPAETLFTQIRADGGAGRDELRGGAGSDILPASM